MLHIIDISPLIEGDEDKAKSTRAQIHDALREMGVFYINGHGISQDEMLKLEHQMKEFFKLPSEKKRSLLYKNNKGFRGYLPMGSETTANQADVKEGFLFGSEEKGESPIYGHNVFPSDLPNFQQDVRQFIEKLHSIGNVISKAFFVGLHGEGERFFESKFNPPFYHMNLWHYPSNPELGQFGIGQHTDYEAFTLLMQDDIGGLQVQRKDGTWIDAPPITGTLLVMIGDAVECWTNGLYRAPVHRVKNAAETSRYSLAFFFQPNLDTVIEPLDIPEILAREFEPTRKGLTLPYHYGQQLYLNYKKSIGIESKQ